MHIQCAALYGFHTTQVDTHAFNPSYTHSTRFEHCGKLLVLVETAAGGQLKSAHRSSSMRQYQLEEVVPS